MRNHIIKWKRLFAIVLTAVFFCSSDSVSMLANAVQENGEQTENFSGTVRKEIKKLRVHCRASDAAWSPVMDVSDDYMRSVIDFYVVYEGSKVNELVQNSYKIQWIQEDGTVLSGIPENAGKYTVKIILDQSLAETAEMEKGQDSFSFIIRKLNLTNAIIGLYGPRPEWTGQPVLPNAPYLANSSYQLPEDTYELQFVEGKNCVEPGMGYVKAVAKGPNVEGEKEFSYQIYKAHMDLTFFQEEIQKEFVYDGTGKCPILQNSYDGIQEIRYGNFYNSNSSRLEGPPIDAGNYKCYIQLIPEDSDHYVNGTWYQDYTIAPRKLEADVQVEKSKVYDTGTGIKTPQAVIKNLVQDDEVTLSSWAEYDSRQAGKNKTISVSFALSGKDAGNYTAPDGFTLPDGEIRPKEVRAGNIVLQSYYYNGSREVPLDDTAITDKSHWVLTGAYSSVDEVALDKSEARAFMEDADVGERKPVTFTGLKLTGADSGNYFLEQPEAAVTVRRIQFSDAFWVEMPDYQYGSAVPEPSLLRYEGDGEIIYKFRKGDSEEEYQEWKEIGPQTLLPGKYEIIAEVTDTVNFEGGTTVYPQEFYVNSLSPELTGTRSWEKTYGDEPFYLDVKHKGTGQLRYLVSQGQDILSVDAEGKVTVKKAGEAVIQVIFDKTDLYRADSISVKISVAKAIGSASVSQEGWVYDPQNSNVKLPVSISETNGTDEVAYQYKPRGEADSAYTDEIPVNAGDYTVKAVFAETENYHQITAEADFTIAKAQAQITGMEYYLKRYGDEPFTLNLTKTGDGSLTYEITDGMEVVNIEEDGMVTIQRTGTVHIVVSMAATANYEAAANVDVKIIVSRGQGKASVKLEDWVYSPDNENANFPLPLSETNGINHVSYLYKIKGAADESYTTEVPVNAGEYTVKAVFAETGNYLQAEATADFQILKKKNPENMPTGNSVKISAAKTMCQLKEVSLPEGWYWKEPDAALVPGGIVTAEAVYGDDENYEQYQVQIDISKAAEIITSYTDEEYIIGEDTRAVIKCTGALSELQGVEVDNARIDTANYLLQEGSTIVIFQKAYLDTLSVEAHAIRLNYTAGNVETILTVKKKQTGGSGEEEKPGGSGEEEKPGDNGGEEQTGGSGEEEKTDGNGGEKKPGGSGEEKKPGSHKPGKTPNAQTPVAQAPGSQTQNISAPSARTENTGRPATGDSSSVSLYILLLLFSAGVMAAAYTAHSSMKHKKQVSCRIRSSEKVK